eukprot:TRINITY_DN7445_c0_g1_i1.p1 TRINITY_DN7445_c0_g1~~TRINITY_DN7445_c0_g1_i1.p1  ORF type:complete len:571 (+),score=64.94 TRINITY_DN7445_c0_g1_i1:43-1755(+)
MGEEDYDDIAGEVIDDRNERKSKRMRIKSGNEVDDFSDGFRERDERTVHVRPLPDGMTKYELKSELEVYGEIEHVQIVRERRFAFVHFADANDANALTERGSASLGGNHEVQVNPPMPPGSTNNTAKEKRHRPRRKSAVDANSDGHMEKTEATVRISPVPAAMKSKADISAEFEIYGEVVHVHIVADRTCAFVHFADVHAAIALREREVVDIDGEEVQVQAANVPAGPSIHFEKRKQIERQLEVVQRFQDDSSDPNADVLSFFDSELANDAVAFVNSLAPDAASNVMEVLATLTEQKDWPAIQRVRVILESSDHEQVESMDLDGLVSTSKVYYTEHSKVEAIAKYLKRMGGEGDIGVIGSKFRVKKPDLERWGFKMTPLSKGGQYTVTAPDDLVDIKVSESHLARFPPNDEGRSRTRRGKRTRGDMVENAHQPPAVSSQRPRVMHENTIRSSAVSSQRPRVMNDNTIRVISRATMRSQAWAARNATGQSRKDNSRAAFGEPPRPPLPPPPPLARTRYPAPAVARASIRPSMAPHIAAKSKSEMQQTSRRGQDGRPNERKAPGQRRPFSAF